MVQDSFSDLFQKAIAPAFDKQLAYGDVIGTLDWEIILSAGTITFGDRRSFAIQIIGTEDHHDQSWLWGWANDASNIPAALLHDAEQLRVFGQQHAILELTTALLPLTAAFDGHRIASVASMICQADAYYRCPYTDGALFVTIHQPEIFHEPDIPILRIATVFPQVLMAYGNTIDHRRALESYFRFYHLRKDETATGIAGTDASGNTITATFDPQGRLAGLQTHLDGKP